MATDDTYRFLQEHNRPFSVADLLQDEILKSHGKAAIQKSLDKLVDQSKIFEKLYGKQKIYCIVQEDIVNKGEIEESLRKMEQEICDISENLKDVTNKLRENTNELKTLKGKMTMKQAKIERENLIEEISALKLKLESFKSNSKPISDEEKCKINADYQKYLKEYKKRKQMCLDIINAILEGYPKTKKHLLEDIGIETDEDVGFKLE